MPKWFKRWRQRRKDKQQRWGKAAHRIKVPIVLGGPQVGAVFDAARYDVVKATEIKDGGKRNHRVVLRATQGRTVIDMNMQDPLQVMSELSKAVLWVEEERAKAEGRGRFKAEEVPSVAPKS